MDIVEVKSLYKIYGKGDTKVTAVCNVNLNIKRGQFVSIIGESGSGKSTLLHMLGGIDKPSKGNVFIEGENIYEYNDDKLSGLRRKKIGFIFQDYNLIPMLSVEENIKMPILLDDKKVDEKFVNDLMTELKLDIRKKHMPFELSGGQQQRVSIARALSNNPEIILADEPTGNLDKKSSEEVIFLLSSLVKKYGKTLILITHDMELANLADRVIKIEDGVIISDEVIKNEKL